MMMMIIIIIRMGWKIDLTLGIVINFNVRFHRETAWFILILFTQRVRSYHIQDSTGQVLSYNLHNRDC